MDLYGGRPGQFHLHGMNGTPKEGENLEILQLGDIGGELVDALPHHGEIP
jgi:hypothetical protein